MKAGSLYGIGSHTFASLSSSSSIMSLGDLANEPVSREGRLSTISKIHAKENISSWDHASWPQTYAREASLAHGGKTRVAKDSRPISNLES